MKNLILSLFAAYMMLPAMAAADVRELTQGELRAAVAEQKAIATARLIAGVENYTGGQVVEIRAFDVEDSVTYRVLVRQDTGSVGSIMVDASTGYAVSDDTSRGKKVRAFAQDQPSITVVEPVVPTPSTCPAAETGAAADRRQANRQARQAQRAQDREEAREERKEERREQRANDREARQQERREQRANDREDRKEQRRQDRAQARQDRKKDN